VTPARARVLVAAAVFAASVAVLFPTDALVRRALVRPGWPPIAFESAHVRPGGIRLDDVRILDATGRAYLRAETLRLHPSLSGLVAGRHGLPWTIDGTVCGGRLDATVTAEGVGTAVGVTWRDADLGQCPPLAIAGGALTGRADGTARLRLAPGRGVEGEGTVAIARASWKGPNLFARLFTDSAAVRWRLTAGRLALEGIDVRAPSLAIYGAGEVRLAEPVDASALDLKLTMASAPGAAGNPLSIDGTLAQPEVHFK
jgi:type II secretion system protein N